MARSCSKRGAPAFGERKLSDRKLVEAALKLIDERGAAAVSMRSLALEVEATPMALYNHFASKRDLLAAVADHVISSSEFDGGHTDWRAQISHCFKVLRAVCLAHPGLPGLLEQGGAAPASAFAPLEVTLQALGHAGLNELDSLRTFFLLISFTLGQAAYQAGGPVPNLDLSEQVGTPRLSGRGYTAIERLKLPVHWDFDASFAFGLSLILDGVQTKIEGQEACSGGGI